MCGNRTNLAFFRAYHVYDGSRFTRRTVNVDGYLVSIRSDCLLAVRPLTGGLAKAHQQVGWPLSVAPPATRYCEAFCACRREECPVRSHPPYGGTCWDGVAFSRVGHDEKIGAAKSPECCPL